MRGNSRHYAVSLRCSVPTNKTVTRTTKYPPYLSGNGIVVRVPIVTVVFGVQPFANTAAFPLSSKQNNIFLLSNSVFGFTFNGAVSAYIFLAVIFSGRLYIFLGYLYAKQSLFRYGIAYIWAGKFLGFYYSEN